MTIPKQVNQLFFQMNDDTLENIDNFVLKMECINSTENDREPVRQYLFNKNAIFCTILNIKNNLLIIQIVFG